MAIAPYAIAVAAVSMGTIAGLGLQQFVDTNPIAFLLFVPPILGTAMRCGLRPSLFATLLGGVSAELFFRLPYFSFPSDTEELVHLALYLAIGAGISVLGDRLARARQDAQIRERDLNSLMQMNPIGIAIAHDPGCERISVNPAMAEMLRIRTSNVASLAAAADDRPDFSVEHDGVPVAAEDQSLRRAARLGVEIKHVERDVVRADGTRVSLYEYATPLFDDGGQVRGAIGAFLDITERRQAEEALKQALSENAELYREAQEANRLKDQFLATLSHELRTPLNALLGWIQLLRSGQLPEAKRMRALDAIERSAELQARLTSDLLDVSAVTTGKLRLARKEMDLAALLDGVVYSLRPAADAKGVALEARIAPNLPLLTLDQARMQQVLWNVISNAVKFTPANGVVTVSAGRSETDVVIAVVDSGVGIPAAFLPYVFDRFRQADSGTTRKHAGLGLGLAIVRHIVELHHGTVTAASEGDGKGSTFTIRLPVSPPTPDPTPLPARLPGAAPDPPPS